MNNFTVIAALTSKPEMQYVGSDQKPMAVGKLELLARGKDDADVNFSINCKAWGKTAERFAEIKSGTTLLISGALNMLQVENDEVKSTVSELGVSEFQVLECPLVAFNKVTIVGNTGRDPESMHFESGKNNAKTSLAVRRTKTASDWFAIEAWGKTAEVMAQYVTKGSKIGVTGSLSLESWTCKTTGLVRSKPVVKVDRLEILSSKQESSQQASAGYSDDF